MISVPQLQPWTVLPNSKSLAVVGGSCLTFGSWCNWVCWLCPLWHQTSLPQNWQWWWSLSEVIGLHLPLQLIRWFWPHPRWTGTILCAGLMEATWSNAAELLCWELESLEVLVSVGCPWAGLLLHLTRSGSCMLCCSPLHQAFHLGLMDFKAAHILADLGTNESSLMASIEKVMYLNY